MRISIAVIFIIAIIALIACSIIAHHSHKAIGKSVAFLNAAAIPPVIGNLLITLSDDIHISTIGYYFYFIGMNIFMYALINFTINYCKKSVERHKPPFFLFILLFIDTVQLLLNNIFGHAFSLEKTEVDGYAYYKLVPHIGQVFHRIVDYGTIFCVFLIFTIIIIRISRIYREKYSIILISLIVVTIWQTYYIFSRTPVDRSMVGIATFTILVFYFSLYYRPLRLLDRMMTDVISDMPEALYVFDPNDRIIWANNKGYELFDIHDGNLENVPKLMVERFGDVVRNHGNWSAQRTTGFGNDTKFYELENRDLIDRNGKYAGAYFRIDDITEEKIRVKKEMYEATHDRLTGLYTREYLYRQISETLQNNRDQRYAIIYIDVRNFKIVNDIFGTEFGDYAIKYIADRIRFHSSKKTVYGRLVGDTFGMLAAHDFFDPDLIESELANFRIKKDDIDHPLLVHLGVYEVTDHDMDVSVMFDRAHISLSSIKEEFGTHIAFYDETMKSQILWNQNLSSELDNAINERQIIPYLQPIADPSGNIIGAEALARWNHPKEGFLPPSSFISLFEDNGMIVKLDKYMWRCACEILSHWVEEGKDRFISVNISTKDFYFMDVVSEFKKLVKEFKLDPSRLRIEITETVMVNNTDLMIRILESFKKEGFIVEMDDFGSGYSSLSMLKDIPVDVLKIDMKFLQTSNDREKDLTIMENIINLSEGLGLISLTEGVETEEQYNTLVNMGCKLFQGYYFAKPMPIEDFDSKY